ncbi:MAG: hypothetical protein B7Z78_10215 [Rhodospirillales bacterium 20-60-12]|nr:MAG: hypothetical protein B7Z78_10215 [Rhodospirillales bacterium 20-60-12]HQT68555.1 energy transducer TonB [Acetobacteraceae bacterium]
MTAMTMGGLPPWKPEEMGLPRATAATLVIIAVTGALMYGAIQVFPQAPPKPPLNVTEVKMVTLAQPKPPPPPPPPPKVVPPKLEPIPIPKPPPIPSRIVVPTKPPPKPVIHRVVPKPPPPVVQAPVVNTPPPPPQPAVQNTSGIPAYAAGMHDMIENNITIPPALASLGLSGTATIQAKVDPNGHVEWAKVIKSSGNPLIDKAALDGVLGHPYRPFTSNMPTIPAIITVAIEIDPNAG